MKFVCLRRSCEFFFKVYIRTYAHTIIYYVYYIYNMCVRVGARMCWYIFIYSILFSFLSPLFFFSPSPLTSTPHNAFRQLTLILTRWFGSFLQPLTFVWIVYTRYFGVSDLAALKRDAQANQFVGRNVRQIEGAASWWCSDSFVIKQWPISI